MITTNDLRDEHELMELRPLVPLDNSSAKAIERFQNEVLRPILKYQNDLLLRFFLAHPHAENILKHKQNGPAFREKLHQYINRRETKNQIIGVVIGLFTQQELDRYFPDSKSQNKRIIQMAEQRLYDNL